MKLYPTYFSPRTLLLAIFLIAIAGSSAFSQSSGPYKRMATSRNLEVADTLSGINLIAMVTDNPANGTVTRNLLNSGSGNTRTYEFKYQPNPGFIGQDTFLVELTYINNFPYLVYQAYTVSVHSSILVAKPDFVLSNGSAFVDVNVLANDMSSNAPLTVTAIPMTNHGSAVINSNGTVRFTPNAGYAGIAHFNYVVCDAAGNCKTSSVDVSVNNSAIPASTPLRLSTAKNTALSVPMTHSGYAVFTAPSHGLVTLLPGHIFRYEPQLNFTGIDSFQLVNNSTGTSIFRSVTVDILNTPTQNTMAMDDYIYTPVDQSVIFNVKDNDIGGLLVKGLVVASTNFPGTIDSWQSNGQIKFTPKPGYSGVAKFKYYIGNMQAANVETATVNVLIGNMNPSQGSFDLTTPIETPLVINYQIPFLGYDFAVLDQPDNGTLEIKQGFWSGTINGQAVRGYNLLIFTPYPGYVGPDEFELNYCIPATNQCQSVKIVVNITDISSAPSPYCVDGCVWAGDTNYDGVVNNKDLLPLGYFMGINGNDRPNASLEWYGQYANNWANPFAGYPLDLKHVDTDGDGDVTSNDTAAIKAFYGQTHSITPTIQPTSKGLPFFLNNLNPDAGIGDLVEFEVSLGKQVLPVTNIYGFTFDVTLSPQIVDSAFQMSFDENVWTNFNAPSLHIQKRPRQGRLETAFTRTNGEAASGYGKIGKFSYIIVDVIDGAKPDELVYVTLTLDGIQTLSADGSLTSFEGTTIEIPINLKKNTEPATQVGSNDLFVFPSPASDLVRVHLNGNNEIKRLALTNTMGKEVWNSGVVQWKQAEINVSQLPSGVYFAVAETMAGKVVKKFVVAR